MYTVSCKSHFFNAQNIIYNIKNFQGIINIIIDCIYCKNYLFLSFPSPLSSFGFFFIIILVKKVMKIFEKGIHENCIESLKLIIFFYLFVYICFNHSFYSCLLFFVWFLEMGRAAPCLLCTMILFLFFIFPSLSLQ